jgi:N-acetylneuraminic acid mutarotase
MNDGSFLIFGGFVKGTRVSEVVHFDMQGQTLVGKALNATSAVAPVTRASMSAGVNEGKLWVFGGQDEENNKLNDLWCFDPSTESWSQIKPKAGDYTPLPRSGHSTVTYGSKMYIFGGIVELTKELNDFIVFDFTTGKFSSSDEANQACFGTNSPDRMNEEAEDASIASPVRRTT